MRVQSIVDDEDRCGVLSTAKGQLARISMSVCVCVLGGVKENNKQNKKFKVGWPFSVA